MIKETTDDTDLTDNYIEDKRFLWLIFNRITQTGLDASIAYHPETFVSPLLITAGISFVSNRSSANRSTFNILYDNEGTVPGVEIVGVYGTGEELEVGGGGNGIPVLVITINVWRW